jgi:hypothetical protein
MLHSLYQPPAAAAAAAQQGCPCVALCHNYSAACMLSQQLQHQQHQQQQP